MLLQKKASKKARGAIPVHSFIHQSRLNAPAKASLFYTLGTIVTRATAFLLTPILTRLLSSSEYGAYTLFNSILSILTIFGTLELSGSVFWRALQKFENSRAHLIRSAELLLILLCSLCFLAFIPISQRVFGNSIFPGAKIMLLASLLANATVNLYTARCRFFCKYRFTLISSLVLGILAPGAACLAAIVTKSPTANPLSVKVGISTAILVAFSLPIFIHIVFSTGLTKNGSDAEEAGTKKSIHGLPLLIKSAIKSNLTFWKYLLRLALPMLPYYLSLSVLAQSDKLIISRILGSSALGSYSVAYSAGSALFALSSGICHTLSPWVMRKVRSREYAKIRPVFSTAVDIICPSALVFLSFSPELFSFLAPQEYIGGLCSVFPIALSAAPIFLSSLLTSAAMALEKVRGVIACGGACATASVVLNFVLLERFGIFSAAAITLASYLALLLLLSLYFKKITGYNLINVNRTLHIMLISIFCAMTIFVFRDLVIIRIAFAILAASYLLRRLFCARVLIVEAKRG